MLCKYLCSISKVLFKENIYTEGELDEALPLKKFGNSEFQQKAPDYYTLDVMKTIRINYDLYSGRFNSPFKNLKRV